MLFCSGELIVLVGLLLTHELFGVFRYLFDVTIG
jgi:hypothetical protein